MAARPAEKRPQPRSYDLRERKRTRTRLMIQTEALRLFAEKGYARTTIEEIADAAAISPRTSSATSQAKRTSSYGTSTTRSRSTSSPRGRPGNRSPRHSVP